MTNKPSGRHLPGIWEQSNQVLLYLIINLYFYEYLCIYSQPADWLHIFIPIQTLSIMVQ